MTAEVSPYTDDAEEYTIFLTLALQAASKTLNVPTTLTSTQVRGSALQGPVGSVAKWKSPSAPFMISARGVCSLMSPRSHRTRDDETTFVGSARSMIRTSDEP